MPYEIAEGTPDVSKKYIGRNVSKDLMPSSSFFIDVNTGYTQTPANKFGIIGQGENSTFRTTSKISYTGSVFAACQGFVLIQPNSADPNKVNLILKPFSQPIKGLSIKYFIYRGLNKNSFFTPDGKVVSTGALSEFVTLVRKDFTEFYQKLNVTVPPFLAEYIGYPSSDPNIPFNQQQKTTDLIDDYFFKAAQIENGNENAKEAYDLPIIPRGTHLGNATGQLGIDVVLDEGDYSLENDPNPFQLNLGFARLADHVLDPATASTVFEKKLLKESAANFMDIAAFYGMHAETKGKIYTAPNTSIKDKDAIYNLIKDFKTSNTFYLYIQSNRQRSYNYYGNYKTPTGLNIKIGDDENSLQTQTFETETWPVKIFDASSYTKYFLSLLHDKNYRGNLFFIEVGKQKGKNKKNNFAVEGDYINFATNVQLDYTLPVEFEISGIASINRLMYLGANVTYANNQNTQYIHYDYIKELYPVINVRSRFSGTDTDDFSKISYYRNAAINLSDYSNTQYHSIIQNQLIFYNGKKEEAGNVTEKRKVLLLGKKKDNLDTVNANDVLSAFGSVNSFTVKHNDKDDYLKFLIFGNSNFSIYHREITETEGDVAFKVLNIKKDKRDERAFFSIGVTHTEFQNIMSAVPQNSANVRYFLKIVAPNVRADIHNIGYYKYSLGVSYDSAQGLGVSFPANEVLIYGDRLNFLCSKEFSEYEWGTVPEETVLDE
ncbi:hypothetical protein [Chryseobacterium sp.]|uniref:hypothetical protein n=1 Tax=Chryseobacterium sp. TaxID=1871047 RepID=UPI0025C19F7C|nr:hypothetical protein [Chryseobacterium sp.]MBV8328824.1 hypothetical protein [Chryseobacterium sp.]